jgi:uroporphyrinogen decarboxylase
VNDRFLRACRREPVDATPVWFMRQAGRSLPEYRAIRERATLADIVRDPALCTEVTLQPVRRLGVDAAILFADITTPLPGIGVDVELVDGVGPVIDRPVRTAEDVARLRRLEPRDAMPGVLDAIRLLRRELEVPLIGFAGAPFTLAAYMVEGRAARDAGALKRLLHAEPDVAGDLLDALVDATVAYLRAQIEAGVQAVQLFDSWVGALSPFDYARHVRPRMTRLFAGLADLGVPTIHFGTGAVGLLPQMAEAGGDVIGVDWRVGLREAWQRIDDHAGQRGVQGNLDPGVLLGPWETAQAQARWVLDEAGGRPGHIFNLGHGVLPATEPDQLRRLVDLVHAAVPVVAAS